jgi:hypothetical protein
MIAMRVRFLMIGLLCASGAAIGCGGPKYVPVSGRVTLDGKPLVNATVVFQPVSEERNPGPGSHGKTDRDGRFTLTTMTDGKAGALVGKHKVTITAYEGDDEIPSSGSDMKFRKRIYPVEAEGESKLTFEVPAGGSNEANFDLSTESK